MPETTSTYTENSPAAALADIRAGLENDEY
jgi:hypothetical protein